MTKLNICRHMLASSTRLQNMSFHVVERARTCSKCQKMNSARAKRAKILFFIVKYANLWGFFWPSSPWFLSFFIFQRVGENVMSYLTQKRLKMKILCIVMGKYLAIFHLGKGESTVLLKTN